MVSACFQAKGLIHTSPGQRPGILVVLFVQANGLPHRVHGVRPGQTETPWPQPVSKMNRAFSAQNGLWTINPGRCPGLV